MVSETPVRVMGILGGEEEGELAVGGGEVRGELGGEGFWVPIGEVTTMDGAGSWSGARGAGGAGVSVVEAIVLLVSRLSGPG